MNTQTFARLYCIVFLIVGIGRFHPGSDSTARVPRSHHQWFVGNRTRLVPVNALHNVVHISFGVWGLMAASSLACAVLFARGVPVIYALLTVLGLIPATNTALRLVPIYGHDVWLHAMLAAVAGYFGFVRKDGKAAAAAV